MTRKQTDAVIHVFAEVLRMQDVESERMETLEKFDYVFGANIPGWEERIIEQLQKGDGGGEAIKSVEAFYAKNHVYDENGNLVYSRIRMGNAYHSLTVTFDSNAPEGMQFKVEEIPNLDCMSLEKLKVYYEEIEEAISNLEDEEPDKSSEAHEKWEDEMASLVGLMEDLEERIEDLSQENR